MLVSFFVALQKHFPFLSPRNYVTQAWNDTVTSLKRVARDRAALVTIILLALPWWSLIFIRSTTEWLEPFTAMVGTVFAFWWMSRSGGGPLPEIKKPRVEFLLAIALVVWWILWRIGICTPVFFFLPDGFKCFRSWEFELLPKLLEQVVFPIAVLFLAGYRFRAQGLDFNWRSWWVAMPVLLAYAGYGIYSRWNDMPGFAKSTGDYFLAAGVPEEVLFRALLLTRLEAWFKNPGWALFVASAIFGLTHLPIDYLFFTNRDWTETWIAVLTFQMGFGAAFAFAYQRTRNIWALAVIHALVDAL